MKKIILVAGLLTLSLGACKRSDDGGNGTEDFATKEQYALNDFVDIVAIPQYADLALKADALNATIVALNTNPTAANLTAARTAWTDMRAVWEQCEGFLFGPVDYDEYDPHMDTWPTDFTQMDSLMNTSLPLTETNLQNITLSLRGFHPIEYIIFGEDGKRTAGGITTRQREYMLSLAADLRDNCHALANSWSAAGGNYGELVKKAGKGSSAYATRREIFLALTDGLTDICGEVGASKMEEPLGATPANAAPELVESPYSGNSVSDFKNNIIGLQNVYLSRYGGKSGRSLSAVVAANNQALDNTIKSQIITAISSFDNITDVYGKAITTQRPQIKQTQAALEALQQTLDVDLRKYVMTYIKD